jgi:hypothetical protein
MRVIEKVERNFWNELVENCSYATFFHTPYWSDLMAKTFSYMDITKGFVFDDGSRAVLPLMRRKGQFFKNFLYEYVSGPPYTYGGPIADRELRQDRYDEIIEYINTVFKRYYRVLIRGNPYNNNFETKGYKAVRDLSHVLKLNKCKSEDDLFKSYGKRYRSYIRKALKSGELQLKNAQTLDEYERLYDIYQKSKKYWDKDLTQYPLLLFRNLYNMKSRYINLWTVYYNGLMIGGDVTLYWNNKCYMWLSYHDREHSKLHARRYMLHKVFLECIERGIKYYDFLQSAGIKSQENFKISMGGIGYPHRAWLKENLFIKYAKQVKRIVERKHS